MEVELYNEQVDVSEVLTMLLNDFSTVTSYRVLRDSLPRRLASVLKCRCILIYLCVDEALQLASGSFDDIPGWSSALLAVAHINPIKIHSELPEARAWRERRAILQPSHAPTLLALPLMYRQHCTGVLVAIRGRDEKKVENPTHWSENSVKPMMAVAGVVALLLENVRLLEHDHGRIRELSLLNSMSSQMNSGIYEVERLRTIILQRTKEIAAVDLCDLLEPATPDDAIAWMHPRLRELLLRRFQEQRSPRPLIIESPGDYHDTNAREYFAFFPESVKTFFAFPLLSGRMVNKQNISTLRGALSMVQEASQMPTVLGCIVGIYYRPWKISPAEIALLRVLASQTSTVLENMRLMEEVVKARNEARTLLRQVMDDQRMNTLILESVPSGLITTDQDNCIHTFNRAAEVILGYHHYEVLGQPLHKYLDLDLLSTVEYDASYPNPVSPAQKAFFAAMHTGEAQHQTVITVDRHDRELVLTLDIRPLYNDSGKQVGTLIAFTDMTLMHRLEEEKRRLDRLASLGEMAANVAHEVRNPLASIKTSIQLLRDDLVQNESQPMHKTEMNNEVTDAHVDWTRESIAVILKEVERLDTIVHELLLFAKPHRLHRARCIIQDLIDHVFTILEYQSSEVNVEVHRIYENVAPIWLDTDQIEQVLLNLCLNAIQAMPDGGILTVVCQRISTEQAIYDTAGTACPPTQRPSGSFGTAASAYAWLIDRHASQKELRVEHWLEIIIRDTGVGITNDQLENIFQPFYTTKAHGIGLGLAITRRLVEDHGGYLRVESHFGYGTTMAVRLPFVTDEAMQQDDVQENA